VRRATPALLLLLPFAFPDPSAAQRLPLPPVGAVEPATPTAELAAVEGDASAFLLLPGRRVDTRYVPEALDRAARVQARLEALHDLWQPFARGPLLWRALVLDRPAWERLLPERAWGGPARLPGGLFVLPARGDLGTIAWASALLGGPPPDPGGEPLVGTRAEAGSLLVCDVLLQLEAARVFAESARLAADEPWVSGVLVQLAARYAWEAAEPGRMLGIAALFDRITATQGGLRAERLEDYRDGLEFERDLWFQAQFLRGADAIWVAEGPRGTARRLDRWLGRGRPPRAAELERLYPALADWRRIAFAP
jgi:hypothetical protein